MYKAGNEKFQTLMEAYNHNELFKVSEPIYKSDLSSRFTIVTNQGSIDKVRWCGWLSEEFFNSDSKKVFWVRETYDIHKGTYWPVKVWNEQDFLFSIHPRHTPV